jgi:hypothetical protein
MSCCVCSIFFANNGLENKCSVCYKRGLTRIINPTIKDLIKHNDNIIPSRVYEDNLKELFKGYASKKLNNNYILINTDTKYKTLRKIADQYIHNSNSLNDFMAGKCEYPLVFFTAKYADMLLVDLEKIIPKKVFYVYVHLIANHTIDIWNIESKNSVLLCYHKDFGDLVECPNNYQVLKCHWKKYKRGIRA